MVSTSYYDMCGKIYTGVMRLVLGWMAIAAMGANGGYAETGVNQWREFLKTPYPRVAMLWAAVRGDNSLAGMTRHDLIVTGVGSLGLKWDGEPKGVADRFTADSIAGAKKRIADTTVPGI